MTSATVKHKCVQSRFHGSNFISSRESVYGDSIGGFKLEPILVSFLGVVVVSLCICFGGVCLQVFVQSYRERLNFCAIAPYNCFITIYSLLLLKSFLFFL